MKKLLLSTAILLAFCTLNAQPLFRMDPNVIVCGGTPVFGLLAPANMTSYHWDMGNGTTGNSAQAPATTYTSPGNYTISLTVSNNVAFSVISKIEVVSSNNFWGGSGVCSESIADFFLTLHNGAGDQLYSTNVVFDHNPPTVFDLQGILNTGFRVKVWDDDHARFGCWDSDFGADITIPANTANGTTFFYQPANLTLKVYTSMTNGPVTLTRGLSVQAPSPTIEASPTHACQGQTVTLTAPVGYTSYQWSNGATVQSISVSQAGTYSVTVSNGACQGSDSFTLTFDNPTIGITGTPSYCPNGSTTLTATGGGTYKWSNGATSSVINVSTSGTYTVTVTSSNGCSATKSVEVEQLPRIEKQQFTMIAYPANAASYQWYSNGISIPGATNQTYDPPASAYYEVEVGGYGPACKANFFSVATKSLEDQDNAWRTYPNPTTGLITVESTGEPIESIALYDFSGNILERQANTDKMDFKIDLGKFPSGNYMLLVWQAGEKSTQIVTRQ